jgi:predicted GNAT family acetyltransferase
VTLLRPARLRGATSVVVLTDRDRAEVETLVDADPMVNAVAAAKLHATGSLAPGALGATPIGVRAGGSGTLLAAALHGGTLMPIGGDAHDWEAIASYLLRRPRACSSIVGRADAVLGYWAVLAPRWGPARGVREAQPLLVLDRPGPAAADERVGIVRRDQLHSYLQAAAAMFIEELGVPAQETRRPAFRSRVSALIESGRAFAIFGRDGRVLFKADIGAVSAHTCQVQGVWVRPDLRGRGLGTAALAGVLRYGLTLAPTVSLYVNDFNVAARRMYAKLGMQQQATLATVLL